MAKRPGKKVKTRRPVSEVEATAKFDPDKLIKPLRRDLMDEAPGGMLMAHYSGSCTNCGEGTWMAVHVLQKDRPLSRYTMSCGECEHFVQVSYVPNDRAGK
jgi:ribosomal protein S27AE